MHNTKVTNRIREIPTGNIDLKHILITANGVSNPYTRSLEAKGLGIQQETSVWVGSPKSPFYLLISLIKFCLKKQHPNLSSPLSTMSHDHDI